MILMKLFLEQYIISKYNGKIEVLGTNSVLRGTKNVTKNVSDPEIEGLYPIG